MKQKHKILILLFSAITLHFMFIVSFRRISSCKNELVTRFEEYKKKEGVRILFLGDSHVERSVDAGAIENAFSLAYYGENNVMCYYRLKYCIDNKLPKPRYIVMPCDLPTFSKGFNAYRTNRFFYYSLIPFSELDNFEQSKGPAKYDYLKTKVFPYSEWQYGLNIYNANRRTKSKKRFSDLEDSAKKQNAKNFIQNEMYCAEAKENLFYPTALSYLEKTIELCKKEDIRLVFVKFPCTSFVFEEVKAHVDPSYITDRPAEKLLQKNNLPLLDFEYEFLNKDYLFFDCHHLNDSGKVVFMPIFKEKLDSLLKMY